MKQFQSLRMLPEQVEKRFVALDEEFDGVCEEMFALFDDLAEWARNADTFSGRTNKQVENEVRCPES
jgi:DNA-binding ferritin-like protein